MKKIIFAFFLISYLFVSCNQSNNIQSNSKNKEIYVLAAASLTDVLTELANNYKEETSTEVIFSFASSGALQAQIEASAPADIFFSAAQKQMNALEEKGLIDSETRKDLLENKVVLISPKKLGLGEPKSVPVGQYSEEILSNLSILDIAKEKAVYGSDVRNVLDWVETAEVDCGIVYSTDAKIAKNINIIAEAPEGTHKKVIYPISIIKYSDKSKEIFQNYGFTVVK